MKTYNHNGLINLEKEEERLAKEQEKYLQLEEDYNLLLCTYNVNYNFNSRIKVDKNNYDEILSLFNLVKEQLNQYYKIN